MSDWGSRPEGRINMNKMEFEARKIYFSDYLALYADVEDRSEEILRMENRLYPGLKKLDGMPHASKGAVPDNGIESCIVSFDRMRSGVRREVEKLKKKRDEIRAAIDSAPTHQMRRVLKLHYVDGLKWEEVAECMHYSLRNVRYLHDRAIRKVKIPGGEIKRIIDAMMDEDT